MIQMDADSRWDKGVSCEGGEKRPDAECILKVGFLTQAVRSMVSPSTETAKAVGGTGFGARWARRAGGGAHQHPGSWADGWVAGCGPRLVSACGGSLPRLLFPLCSGTVVRRG